MARGENFRDPALHSRDVEIMTEHGARPALKARLMKIDFPGMEIEDEAAAFAARLPKRPLRVPLGKNAKITAAGGGKIPWAQAHGGRRELVQAASLTALPLEGRLGREGHSIDVMMNGEDAGIIEKSLLREDLDSPKRPLDDGETGRSITDDGPAAGILNRGAGATRIGTKFAGRKIPDAAMPVAVAADFVTGGDDLAHDLREALGDPSENEKGGPGSVAAEKIENAARVVRDAGGIGRPAFGRNAVAESFDVEIIFDIHAKSVRKGL